MGEEDHSGKCILIITTKVHTVSMTCHWWSKSWSLGWGTLFHWNFLFYSLFILCSLDTSHHAQPTIRKWGVGSNSLSVEYLHKVLWVTLHLIFVSSSIITYWFTHIFVWVWIPGHFIYAFGYNAIQLYFVPQLVPFFSIGTFSFGLYILLSYPPQCRFLFYF